MPSASLAQGLLVLTQNQKQYPPLARRCQANCSAGAVRLGLDRDLEIFLELARGYRARAEQVGQPCPA